MRVSEPSFLPLETPLLRNTDSIAKSGQVDSESRDGFRVAIVVMPFLAANCPSLPAGLLQSSLRARGICCDTKYFNVTFSKLLGHDRYSQFVYTSSTALAGEWAFSQLFYGTKLSTWESYEQEVLRDRCWGGPPETFDLIRNIRKIAPIFLRMVFESNDWGRYDLVGFTSTFEQTMPSMCLARLIRHHFPHIKLAAGGANFEGPMGAVYMRNFRFLDYVCTGEGDECFPQLCHNLARGLKNVPPGLLHRGDDEVSGPAHQKTVQPVDLDALPFPDFDDFYRVFASCFGDSPTLPYLPIEGARGCWWGERSHCTFCGLNGDTIRFRQKSWTRIAEEADFLESRYRCAVVQFADNILSLDYFKNLLPLWAKRQTRTPKFFEVKSNLSRNQVVLLRDAGVLFIQAGIENFADGTLRLMKKGVSGAQNVAVLRWCAEVGIETHWNIIFGFPQEDPADYEINLDVMRKIAHLNPPDGCGPIRMDRFSPNFTRWKEHGFSSIGIMPSYGHIFDFPADDLDNAACYFAYDHPRFGQVLERGTILMNHIDMWRKAAEKNRNGALVCKPTLDGTYVIVDTRVGCAPRHLALDPIMTTLLLECDGPCGADLAIDNTAQRFGLSKDPVGQAFAQLVDRAVIAVIGQKAITLALMPDGLRFSNFAAKDRN
jgi:ribosomal peptide maturation radical SAM protein 1